MARALHKEEVEWEITQATGHSANCHLYARNAESVRNVEEAAFFFPHYSGVLEHTHTHEGQYKYPIHRGHFEPGQNYRGICASGAAMSRAIDAHSCSYRSRRGFYMWHLLVAAAIFVPHLMDITFDFGVGWLAGWFGRMSISPRGGGSWGPRGLGRDDAHTVTEREVLSVSLWTGPHQQHSTTATRSSGTIGTRTTCTYAQSPWQGVRKTWQGVRGTHQSAKMQRRVSSSLCLLFPIFRLNINNLYHLSTAIHICPSVQLLDYSMENSFFEGENYIKLALMILPSLWGLLHFRIPFYHR